jgi:type II secretory pathway component PulF
MFNIDLDDIKKQWQTARLKNKFKSKRGEFYEDMADAIADGMSVMDYLEKSKSRALKRKRPLAALFSRWTARHEEYGNFSKAIVGTVPVMDAMIINSAEVTGKLSIGLTFLAKTVEETQKMRLAVISAIAMPMFLCVLLTAIMIGYSFFMVPILIGIIPPEQWPSMGKALYSVASLIRNYGVFALIFAIILVYGFSWSFVNWTGSVRDKLDKYLPYAIYRDYNAAVFLVTLASLLKSGISVGDGLKIIKDASPKWLNRHLAMMLFNMNTKGSAAQALNTGLFGDELADRIEDYGERASFQQAIDKIGFKAIDIVTRKVTGSAKIINTLGLLFVGCCLGFIILSVLGTAQEANETIQSSAYRR